ncbi:MAG: hypothetical protein H0T62_06535 [Parachlamydiaceae bacterium]|nr:hypothetical protein [Parachlamydiaceae bacterium]
MINPNLIKFNSISQNVDDLAELAFENTNIDESISKIVYALGKFFGCSNLFWVRDNLADKQKAFLTNVNRIKNVEAIRALAGQLLGEEKVDHIIQSPDNINQFLSLFTSNNLDELNKINGGFIEIEINDAELEEFKEVIRSMRDTMNSNEIQEFVSKADEDTILAQSQFIINLEHIHQEFRGKGALELLNHPEFNDFFEQYKNIQGDLIRLLSCSEEERDDIANDLRNEVIYEAVTSVISVEGFLDMLKDGFFKTYMCKFKKMLTPVKSDWEDSSDSQEFLSFANFEKEGAKRENKDAGKAFRVCAELLELNPDFKSLSESIKQYAEVECTVLDEIQKLQELLDAIGKGSTDNVLGLNKSLGNIKLLMKENSLWSLHSLKKLLVKRTDTAAAYMYLKSLKLPPDEVIEAKLNMRELLGASGKDKIKLFMRLGESAIQNPSLSFLTLENGNIKFSKEPPSSPFETSSINTFLKSILDGLVDGKSYNNNELLSLESVVFMALIAHISLPAKNVDPNSQFIIDTLIKIQSNLNQRIVENDLSELRQSAEYQNFCLFMKKNIENLPGYSKKFWTHLDAAERMQFSESVLEAIGSKIADPASPLDKSFELIHKNSGLGYEIYEYPSSENEKKKLLLFMTGETQWSLIQGIDHQLGLLGDPSILAAATNVISDITSNMILEGFQENFRDGEIEFITAGFGNSGSAAAVVGSKIAALNPNIQVKSISAGSTPVVTTEDAYNISRSTNFFPIRIKFESDQLVDRTQALGDFSDELYHTFPLSVRHKLLLFDRNCHNRMEYGNLDNFFPAMKNPICLRNIYTQVSSDINPVIDGKIPKSILKLLKENVKKEIEPINLTDSYVLRVKEKEKADVLRVKEKEKSDAGVVSTWKDWFLGRENENLDSSLIQVNLVNQIDVSKLKNTIKDLQVTIAYLKYPGFIDSLSSDDIVSMLFAANNRLINTTQINRAVGNNPEHIDLLSEMRALLIDKLQSLPEETRKKLLKLNQINFKSLTNTVESSGIETDFIHKKDLFKKIDFDKRFFEFLGCKIALQGGRRGGIDKIGSDSYVNRLFSDVENHFDISLYTPEASDKKHKIVIFCNDEDKLGNHSIRKGKFSAGDEKIIIRSELLKELVDKKLSEFLTTTGLDLRDVEIVCSGFGTEGAVATALGFQLAKKYEKDDCEVRSIGFGAPPFLAEGGQEGFKDQANFIPLRFLGEGDTRYNFRAQTVDTYVLTEETYYTIPMQFRSVGVTDFGQHTPDLYGDVQNIRIAMQTVKLMRDIACEGKELILQRVDEPKVVPNPKRIIIDTRSNLLLELSQKSAADLIKEEPGKIIHMMKYCVEITESGEITKKQEVFVKALFKNFIIAIKNNDIRQKVPAEGFCKKMINFGYQPHALFAGKLRHGSK